MYPNLYYFFFKEFGWEFSFLKIFNTFGFFVAIAFLSAAFALTLDIKRKEKAKIFNYSEEEILIGEKPTIISIFLQFLIGFIIGYKIINLLFFGKSIDNPQEYLLSLKGNFLIGLICGALLAYYYYKQKLKTVLPKPEKRLIRLWPSDRIGDIVFLAFIGGVIGAKLFFYLEIGSDFLKDPWGYIFSLGGLTFYGGLITAGAIIIYYLKKKNIPIAPFTDSALIGLLLAYGIGRLGCHFSGDGDWGIVNPYDKPYTWLPDWLWSYHYPNNVINDGIPIQGCDWQYNRVLVQGVYPTSVYESIFMISAFFILWKIKEKITRPWEMTSIYLIINGVERFLIEKIRVNHPYDWGFIHPTQAQVIAVIFVITGILIQLNLYIKKRQLTPN
ncbi:MAG: prolipoprotein diacylglyceryl transferase [Sediminibacterium sp.]|nr:prolipoprotein diacylglyceryl transferase [Sediminibacterium sp.]